MNESEHVPESAQYEEPVVVGPAHEGLTVGFVPGVMPSKWFGRWSERMEGRTPLHRLPLEEASGIAALEAGHAHMVLLRPQEEPAASDTSRYHVVTLYEEQPVVVLPQDHLLTLLDEVPVEELAEELLLQDPAEVPAWAEARRAWREAHPEAPGADRLPSMRHRGDAVELVAAGLGLLLLPLSVARFHHRKDLTHRPVTGIPTSEVALVWPRVIPGTRPEPDEAVLQEFVGITRGRRAGSSRGDLAEDGRTAEAGRARTTTKKASPQRSGAKAGGKPAGRKPAGRKPAERTGSSRVGNGRKQGGKKPGRGPRPGRR